MEETMKKVIAAGLWALRATGLLFVRAPSYDVSTSCQAYTATTSYLSSFNFVKAYPLSEHDNR